MKEDKHKTPMIKGVFVMSHINALRKSKGEEGVALLKKRYGKPVQFKYLEDVPVREEVKIIELSLDILLNKSLPPEERAYEAGRLHFRNFSTTPLGRMILYSLPKNIKTVMMRAPYIARHVFKNVRLNSDDLGPKTVKVMMENNDYPVEHFKGLFYEWMIFWKYKGNVTAKIISPTTFEYIMIWE